MNGFLSSRSSLLADLSLILSLLLGLLAIVGAVQAKRRRFSSHCPLLTIAALANWLPVLTMLPNWRPGPIVSLPPSPPVVLVPLSPQAHGLMGGIAQVLMTYTVVRMNWLRSLPPRKTRWLMRAAMGLWMLTLLGGLVVYFVPYAR